MQLNKSTQYILNTDGGARGNPGPSAIGVVISDGETVLFKHHAKIPNGTNNQAEYFALKEGLEICLKFGVRILLVKMDSELVVKQINREYKIKDVTLKSIAAEIFELTRQFESFKLAHIPRNQNKIADCLVNYALDH